MTTTEPLADYPSGEAHHGRRVWELGEDGDQFIVEGHGRRAIAAFSAHLRYLDGPRSLRRSSILPGARIEVSETQVQFHDTCGCTAEQHAQHLADDDDARCDDCARAGLPPCDDEQWAWVADYVKPDQPNALPVTRIEAPR